MIIQNFRHLGNTSAKKPALEILEAGLRSAMPENFIKKFVKKNQIIINSKSIKVSSYSRFYLVSFGKAADSMAKSVDSIIKTKGGIIVVPKGSKSVIKSKKFQIFQSGHPLPNSKSVMASKTILKFLEQRKKNDFVLFLVSGGGSALLALPNKISLKDKILVTKLLLKSGASIDEINCIRKHLSLIKGGRLVKNLNCAGAALVMSDVQNDNLSSISSGCTYYDSSSFCDALNILKKYKIQNKIPKKALNTLVDGSKGKISETPKKLKIPNQIIASNKDCLKTMASQAKKLGYKTKIISVFGDVSESIIEIVKDIPKKEKSCLLFGGETTVKVHGRGKGGRNQELVLRLLKKLQNTNQNLVFASIGTDGIDGNTKHAGAITENFQVSSNIIDSYLQSNNSNAFFKKYGGLIQTGYTKTNLMDIGLILKD